MIFLKYLVWKYQIPALAKIKFCPELVTLVGMHSIVNNNQEDPIEFERLYNWHFFEKNPALYQTILAVFDFIEERNKVVGQQRFYLSFFSGLVWQVLGEMRGLKACVNAKKTIPQFKDVNYKNLENLPKLLSQLFKEDREFFDNFFFPVDVVQNPGGSIELISAFLIAEGTEIDLRLPYDRIEWFLSSLNCLTRGQIYGHRSLDESLVHAKVMPYVERIPGVNLRMFFS